MFSSFIPTSFCLLGHTYKLKTVKKVDSEDSRGEIDDSKKLIRIKKAGRDFSQDMVDEAACHETIHAMLDAMEYPELSKDELLVERMGRALHQMLKTAVYETGKS